MPVQYSSIIEEHLAVRRRVGLFDIGHMGRLDFEGNPADVLTWLERSTTNHVAKLKPGRIQYSLLANDHGGVIDDVLVYRVAPDCYSMVCNASNRLKVAAQLEMQLEGLDARLVDRTTETAMIAVQGPASLATLSRLFDAPLTDLGYYATIEGNLLGSKASASRTGYTGEDGFEVVVPNDRAEAVWAALLDTGRVFGIAACGLGARDTLRFEAAMPLYGHEMDEVISPFDTGLDWVVKLGKGDFVGREALLKAKSNPTKTRVGLKLEGKRIARQGCAVKFDGELVGVVTSGTHSPTLEQSLAMAIVSLDHAEIGSSLSVDVRGRDETATVVSLPFYRRPAPPEDASAR